MEYEKAVSVLKNLVQTHQLTEEEQEAVGKAIGMLTLAYQAASQTAKNLKAKREKATEW
jgi:hypothetical protein